MAQRIRVERYCDLCGTAGAVTITLEYRGRLYEADVCQQQAEPYSRFVNLVLPASRPVRQDRRRRLGALEKQQREGISLADGLVAAPS